MQLVHLPQHPLVYCMSTSSSLQKVVFLQSLELASVVFIYLFIFFSFYLWKWSSIKYFMYCNWLFRSFQTPCIFRWSIWLITCLVICWLWLSNEVNSFLIIVAIGFCTFPFGILLFYITYHFSGKSHLIILFQAKGNVPWNTSWQTKHTMKIQNHVFLICGFFLFFFFFPSSVGQPSTT